MFEEVHFRSSVRVSYSLCYPADCHLRAAGSVFSSCMCGAFCVTTGDSKLFSARQEKMSRAWNSKCLTPPLLN